MVPNMTNIEPKEDWYTYGQTVTPYCPDGYEIIGDQDLVCTDMGTWYGNMPECIPVIEEYGE